MILKRKICSTSQRYSPFLSIWPLEARISFFQNEAAGLIVQVLAYYSMAERQKVYLKALLRAFQEKVKVIIQEFCILILK